MYKVTNTNGYRCAHIFQLVVTHYFWRDVNLPTCIFSMIIVVDGTYPVDEVHTWEVQLKQISLPLHLKQYHAGQVEDP